MEEFNTLKAIEAQREYCETAKAPYFAPYSGTCYCCNQNIYERLHGYTERMKGGRSRYVNTPEDSGEGRFSGISVEKASNELVTGCPHCYKSYCD